MVASLFLVAVVASGETIQPLQGDRRRSLSAGTMTNSYPLESSGCYATRKDGGWGYCGPPSCKDAYVTCAGQGGGPATVDGVTGTYATKYSASSNENEKRKWKCTADRACCSTLTLRTLPTLSPLQTCQHPLLEALCSLSALTCASSWLLFP